MKIKIKKHRITKKDIEQELGIKIKEIGYSGTEMNIIIDDNEDGSKKLDVNKESDKYKIDKVKDLFIKGYKEKVEIE